MDTTIRQIIPSKTWIRLIFIWSFVLFFSTIGSTLLSKEMSPSVATAGFITLLITIIIASFGVVKEADQLAKKLGEPYGTLILTLAVVSIEVILISAVLLGPGENPTIGKDSIFSVMMIILNLVMGLCILLGGLKYGEQEYNIPGSMTYIAMIVLLGGIGMMLPNFITGAGNGIYTHAQAILLSSVIIVLYSFFLYFQTKSHSHLYVQPPVGSLEITFSERKTALQTIESNIDGVPTPVKKTEIWLRSILLIGMLLPIVLLSHHLAVVIDFGIEASNLPPVLGGILIALIVFTPESITAIKATLNNEFQRTINLCQGAFVSTVGLSIPAVLIVGLMAGKTVQFGLSNTETLLYMTTLILSMVSLVGKRTTPIIGMMHLVLFIVFMMLVFVP